MSADFVASVVLTKRRPSFRRVNRKQQYESAHEVGAAVPVFLSFWGVLGGDVDVAAVVCASLRGYPESETRRESERRLSTYKEEVAITSFFSGEVFEAGPDFVGCSERAFTSLSLGLRDIVNKLIRVMWFTGHTGAAR